MIRRTWECNVFDLFSNFEEGKKIKVSLKKKERENFKEQKYGAFSGPCFW